MEKWKDIKLDDESMWPTTGLVELESPHSDDRGAIQSLVNFPMKNLSLISSKKGAVRSNHYHLTDWHYMYVYQVLLTITLDQLIVVKSYNALKLRLVK